MLTQKKQTSGAIVSGGGLAWQTPAVMAFNFFSAVGIIFVNKIIFQSFSFTFATFLTGLHFVITFAGLLVLKHINFFKVKSVKIREVIPLCLAFCGFVIFNNLSLQENTVGFYQIMKVLTTPTVGIIQYSFYSVSMPMKSIIALFIVCIGVAIVTCNELELRPLGFIYSCCGILSTSFYQVLVKTRQQDLGLSPPQLLYYQAPISAVMVFMVSPFLDNVFGTEFNSHSLVNYDFFESKVCIFIAISCLLAFCVNLSIFLTIGRTSPITYNVLGHFKLCLITIGGSFFFMEDMNQRKMFGLGVALVGIGVYTYLKLQPSSGSSNWEKRAKEIAISDDEEEKIPVGDDVQMPLIVERDLQNNVGITSVDIIDNAHQNSMIYSTGSSATARGMSAATNLVVLRH